MTEPILLSRAVTYNRDHRGYLRITLMPDWDGKPRLDSFPGHVQRTVRGRPLAVTPDYAERIRVAREMGPDVYAAVWDDTQCVMAARMVAESTFATDPFRREALRVYGEGYEDPQWIKNLADALVEQSDRFRHQVITVDEFLDDESEMDECP